MSYLRINQSIINIREMTSMLVPFIPCSAKLPIIALFSGYFFTLCAWLLASFVYQIGSRIENGTLNIANLLIIICIIAIVIFIITRGIKKRQDGCLTCPYCNNCK